MHLKNFQKKDPGHCPLHMRKIGSSRLYNDYSFQTMQYSWAPTRGAQSTARTLGGQTDTHTDTRQTDASQPKWQYPAERWELMRSENTTQQESRTVARKPRDAATVLFDLKSADNIHCKFGSSQASNARLQSSKHTGA